MGWYVALCVVMGILGGIWLDKKIDTSPLFTLIGAILGLVVAFYGIYKMMVPLLQDNGVKGNNNGESKT